MHPLIAESIRLTEELVDHFHALGANYPVEPKATGVARVFYDKLRDDPEAAAVPLEELVHPRSLEFWRTVFDDPVEHVAFIGRLKNHGLMMPRVAREASGDVRITLFPHHPDQTENEVISQPRAAAHVGAIYLVEIPQIGWGVTELTI